MTPQMPHSPAWKMYTFVSFFSAAGLVALGLAYAPMELWIKGYFAMGAFFLVGSSFTLAKTLRDEHEASRLINRIEDASTERLLRDSAPGLRPGHS